MNCQECVKECVEDCLTEERFLHKAVPGFKREQQEKLEEHRATAHVSPLTDGFYRYPLGIHAPVEAHPADAMRAAGQEPML